jgi:hypothetical protein
MRETTGQFSNYVLLRVVRLTVETNTLTGTHLSINPNLVSTLM